LTEEEYDKFWQLMGSIGLPLEGGSVPLWKDLQTVLNRSLQELFTPEIMQRLSNPAITIDDDKMHYAANPRASTDSLKLTQHVKENWKGFVDNHIVLTASGTLLDFDFEVVGDENSNILATCLIQGQLRPNEGGSRVPTNLTGYSILAGRLYSGCSSLSIIS
jgi:hypothetical protein